MEDNEAIRAAAIARTREEAEAAAMNDPTISKANEILERLTGEPDVQEMARRRELAQAARLITHGAIHERARLEGEAIGEERGMRAAIRVLCAGFGVPLDETREAALDAMTVAELANFVAKLGTARAWPLAAVTPTASPNAASSSTRRARGALLGQGAPPLRREDSAWISRPTTEPARRSKGFFRRNVARRAES